MFRLILRLLKRDRCVVCDYRRRDHLEWLPFFSTQQDVDDYVEGRRRALRG